MKFFTNIFLLFFIFSFFNAKAISLPGKNAPSLHFKYWHYSNNPYFLNKSVNQSLLEFVKLYDKYQEVLILSTANILSLENIDYSETVNKNVIIDFQTEQCLKNISCDLDKFKFSINLNIIKEELIDLIKINKIPYSSNDYNISAILFKNKYINGNDINSINKGEYLFKLYTLPSLLKSRLDIIEKYKIKKLIKELELFDLELKNNCNNESSLYCYVRTNNIEEIQKYINNQNEDIHTSLKLGLILDFAYLTNNPIMSKYLTELKLQSIHFPDDKSKLYMATVYNYKDVVETILSNNDIKVDIDYEYSSGLTILGLAIVANSFDVIKLLIDKGAIKKGLFSMNYMFHNVKLFIENRDLVFKLLLEKYKSKEIPDLLRVETLMLMRTSGKNTINWLTKLFNEQPILFNSVFVENEKYARQALIESSYSPNSDAFDFLVNHEVNLCIAFDNVAMKSLGKTRIKDESLWLNSRYKQYLKKCEQAPMN